MRNLFCFIISSFIIFSTYALFSQEKKERWLTPAEISNFQETPRYAETMNFLRNMERASKSIRIMNLGKTPEGRMLPLIVVTSKTIEVNPSKAQSSGKAIVLIQNGIHAGEIDGKDACLMLLRDMCILKEKEYLLDKIILLILPFYNLDGHERVGVYNRINQNGPREMGWRTTSQNLNLNRDYMKADAPETRMWLKMFNEWLPDFFIDCHVTDGADYQYVITYAISDQMNVPWSVRNWIKNEFLSSIQTSMSQKNTLMSPYILWKEEHDVTKGLIGGVAPPRFSTEYCVLQNRPGFLIESHMLKDYQSRVNATYQLLVSLLEKIHSDAGKLRLAVREADEEIISAGETADGTFSLPLDYELEMNETNDSLLYLGYQYHLEKSEVSNGTWIQFSNKPANVTIPFFNTVKPTVEIQLPYAYIIPKQWTKVIEILQAHTIRLNRLTRETELEVETYKFSQPKWNERPYEGRHTVNFKTEKISERKLFPEGSLVVLMNQRTAKVAAHLFEPQAPDALVRWGFFDAVFEQKEYGESYVLEKLAREMMEKDAALKKEFESKLASDSSFAKNSYERLNFFYKKSPYWDYRKDVYPVARIPKKIVLPLELKK
ncbi:MAG: peptidase M14 [Ignavibacteria bacterium]|nr:peptidase M14 [Ignavibacteria bacterium]